MHRPGSQLARPWPSRPPRAGMRPSRAGGREPCRGLPRARGDAPTRGCDFPGERASAPRARGCARCHGVGERHAYVSPARGDAPDVDAICTPLEQFAPRARGCTRAVSQQARRQAVPPARAGMNRGPSSRSGFRGRVPRARGDAPLAVLFIVPTPRLRGDEPATDQTDKRVAQGCPADAGMHPENQGQP